MISVAIFMIMIWGGSNATPYCIGNTTILSAYIFKGEAKEKVEQWTLNDNTFALSFTHSITLTPVRSQYKIVDRDIIQTGEIFEAHGYGLPSMVNEVGVLSWVKKNGKFFLNMKRKITPMVVRISQEYNSIIYIKERKIPLDKYDGASLLFRVHCGK